MFQELSSLMFTPRFSIVWTKWVDLFGRRFWPLLGISAILSGLLVILASVLLSTVIIPFGIISSTGELPTVAPTLSSAQALSLAAALVAFLVVAFGLAITEQAAIVRQLEQPGSIGESLRWAARNVWTALRTAWLVLVIVFGPVGIAMVWLSTVARVAGSTVNAMGTIGVIFFFLAFVWMVYAGIMSAFAVFQAILQPTTSRDHLRISWRSIRPMWWKVVLYPVPLVLLSGLLTAVLENVPLVGSLAASALSAAALWSFLYCLYRSALPAPTSVQPTDLPPSNSTT